MRKLRSVAFGALSALAAFGVLCLIDEERAYAADPLNSSDRVTAAGPVKTQDVAAKNDFNFLPVAGGDTDIGVGAGYFAALTRIKKGVEPYVWNLESAGFLTFKPRDGGGVLLPYQDIFAKLTVPRFLSKPMRLEIKPEYTWETLGYYGMGNASSAARPPGANSDYFHYVRVHPVIDTALRIRIVDHLAATTGFGFSQNWIQVTSGSRLDQDIKNNPDPEVKRLLGPATVAHPVAYFKYGAQWDTRDSEVSPTHGTFDEFILKLAPGGENSPFPYRYGQTTLMLRAYVPLIKNRLVLAVRAVGDIFFGDVPFYELSRFADTYAIGGVNGVRGVPAERYSGRVKAFGNVELREDISKFKLFGKPMSFGGAAFFDGGRVWADTHSEPSLDGTGVGLKYGIGLGARVKSGDTFVIRFDVAYSPDATPIGAYLATGELF